MQRGSISVPSENGKIKTTHLLHMSQKRPFKYGELPHAKENTWQNFSYELLMGKQIGHLGEKNLTAPGGAEYMGTV